MEFLQEPLGQLLSGLVAIVLSVITVAAGYGIAYLKKKLKIEDGRRLQEIATDAVAEVEELARSRIRPSLTERELREAKLSSSDKDAIAVTSILDTAQAEKNSLVRGLAVDAAEKLAQRAIKTALGKLKG